MTAVGLALGGNARTGMEDTLMLRRGQLAGSNAELVERLGGVAAALERPITPPLRPPGHSASPRSGDSIAGRGGQIGAAAA